MRNNTIERFMVLLTCVERDARENEEVMALASRPIDWAVFFELCQTNRVSCWVYKNLVVLGLDGKVPAETKKKFERSVLEIKNRNQARLARATDVLRRFVDAGVDVVVLKGMCFAELIYKDSFYKQMNDVDILNHASDLKKIWKVYADADLFSAGELLGKSATEYEEFSHHLPPFFSKDLALMVGTHWGLVSPSRGYAINYSKLWSRVIDLPFHGLHLKSLSPEDNLHHLCIHLSEYKAGLRELMDFYNLLRHFQKTFDAELFLSIVNESKTEEAVFYALSLVESLQASEALKKILDSLRPRMSLKLQRKARARTEDVAILLRSRSIQITRVDKAFAKFKATKKGSEKFRYYCEMWGHVLFPPADEIVKLNHWKAATPLKVLWGRITTPFKIMGSLCHDLGTKIFLLLIVYTFYKTAEYLLKSLFMRQDEDMRKYAEKLGVDMKSLSELQERLE